MQRCVKCNAVDGVIRAGFLRGRQRFFCKLCNFNFVVEGETESKKKKTHQTTIVDVAKHLGVAISTVSRALNDKSDISQETRELVLKAAMELDYRPNFMAQSLHKGETRTIGVIVPDVEHPFFARVLAGIQKVANNTGYRIIVCHSNESYEIETLNIETLLACRVDGLLVSHSKETATFGHFNRIIGKGIPVVLYDRISDDVKTPKIIHQDYKGSFDLVEHLISQGCRRVAIMLGPEGMLISERRLAGYKAALIKHGLEINEDYIVYSGINQHEGIGVFNYLMSLQVPPDGIFTILYRNGIEMIMEAKKRGMKIPEEIAFAGFGDDILAELIDPPMTVFNHFPAKIGEAAILTLIEYIHNKDTFYPADKTIEIEGELIIRQSSMKRSPEKPERVSMKIAE